MTYPTRDLCRFVAQLSYADLPPTILAAIGGFERRGGFAGFVDRRR